MNLEIAAKRIVMRRKDLGLTQKQLSANSGAAYVTLQQIERAEGNPTVGTLNALAEALGFKDGPIELFSKGSKPSQPGAAFLDAGKLLTAIATASAPRRALILALALRDEKYLDELSQETALSLRALIKAI